MSPEILRLKTFANLSFAAIAIIAIGMGVGMVKSVDGQSLLAFFTGGIGGVSTVISLWANPPGGKHSDQVNLSSGGLQVNVDAPTDTAALAAADTAVTGTDGSTQNVSESEKRMKEVM